MKTKIIVLVALPALLLAALGVGWLTTRESGLVSSTPPGQAAVSDLPGKENKAVLSAVRPAPLPSLAPVAKPAMTDSRPAVASATPSVQFAFASTGSNISSPSSQPTQAPRMQSSPASQANPVNVSRDQSQPEEILISAQVPVATSIPPEVVAALPVAEQSALQSAQKAFQKQLAEYGPLDPNSEEYFHAYQESAQASDDFLRAYLGWDRFMSLSAEGIKQAHDQLATGRLAP